MRVLVTGGSGRLGQQVLHELVGHGHEVVNADRRPPGAAGLGPYREVELSDVGHVAGALSGCDAVVHLGAIPTANSHPNEVVFGNNTRATFAVLQAAAMLGIRRAVLGFEVLNITSADSLSDVPTEELMRRYCPDVQLRGRIVGSGSAWSTEKARRLLGYTPRHSWRGE